ncbi:MAG: hypothetical protein M0001_05150 [Treponema sp.]|nr:hypothetical protein [Treponema sp.]
MDKKKHPMREILVFGAAVATAGTLAAFIANALIGIADARDMKMLVRLSKSDSAAVSPLRADYPALEKTKIFILGTSQGTEYGAMIPCYVPGSSGLFAALFSADGEAISLTDVTTDAFLPADHAHFSLVQFTKSVTTKSSNTALIFDPERFELAKTLSSISRAIAESSAKAAK